MEPTTSDWCKKALVFLIALFVIGLIVKLIFKCTGENKNTNKLEYFQNLNSPGPFPVVFELYKVGWCKHCKGMNPEWEKLAKKYEKDPSVQIKTIDVDEFPEAAQAENVTGLPTMILKDPGSDAKIVYEGERTSAIMGEFVESAKANGVPAVMDSTMASTPALVPVPVPVPASASASSSPPDLPTEENAIPSKPPVANVQVPILKKPVADAPMMIIEPDGDDSDAGVGMGTKAQVTGEILAAPV